jgi:hypothetical protein
MSYLNEEVNCTEPFPYVSIPWPGPRVFAPQIPNYFRRLASLVYENALAYAAFTHAIMFRRKNGSVILLSVILLIVIMLIVIMLIFIMLIAMMFSVMTPFR